MKRPAPVSMVLLAVFAIAIPQSAQANDCRDSVSFIQLPDGRCYNLTHLTELSMARQSQAAANDAYRQIVRDNTPQSRTSTTIVGNSRGYVASSNTVSENLSPEERAEMRETISKATKTMGQIDNAVQKVENYAYRKQLRIMSEINGALAPRW